MDITLTYNDMVVIDSALESSIDEMHEMIQSGQLSSSDRNKLLEIVGRYNSTKRKVKKNCKIQNLIFNSLSEFSNFVLRTLFICFLIIEILIDFGIKCFDFLIKSPSVTLITSLITKSHLCDILSQFNISPSAIVSVIINIFGSGNTATINYNNSIQDIKKAIAESESTDKEELKQIVSLLEMVVNNQVPASKGLFSRFSEVMERNSWITGSIAGALLPWLTMQIP